MLLSARRGGSRSRACLASRFETTSEGVKWKIRTEQGGNFEQGRADSVKYLNCDNALRSIGSDRLQKVGTGVTGHSVCFIVQYSKGRANILL